MAYYIAQRSIDKVSIHLSVLSSATGEVWFDTNEPKELLYDIRQGIRAAYELNDSNFMRLADQFSFSIAGNRIVAAKKSPRSVQVTINDKTISGISSPIEVLEILVLNKFSSIYFPDADFSPMLETWANKNNKKVIPQTKGILVTDA